MLWDASTGSSIGTIRSSNPVWKAIFSPDKQHLLTLGSTNPELWNVQSRQRVTSFSAPGVVWKATFSPDGDYLLMDAESTASGTHSTYWLANIATGVQTKVLPMDWTWNQGSALRA